MNVDHFTHHVSFIPVKESLGSIGINLEGHGGMFPVMFQFWGNVQFSKHTTTLFKGSLSGTLTGTEVPRSVPS